MSCKVLSNPKSSIHIHLNSIQSNTNSSLPSSIPNLSFKTHVSKSRISINSSSGSTRIKNPRSRTTITNFYTTEQTSKSFYELLGIPESVDQPEIKRAYKQLALKFHPDVSPPGKTEEYTEKFIRVQEAYETLSDPKTRILYDMDMSKGLHLAFSARKGDRNVEKPSEWMNQWQSQISELTRRSEVKNSRVGNVNSWGDRMRKQRSESC